MILDSSHTTPSHWHPHLHASMHVHVQRWNVTRMTATTPECYTSHHAWVLHQSIAPPPPPPPPSSFGKGGSLFTCESEVRSLKAWNTWFSVTVPPTSRKLAGDPPWSLMMSIVAMAKPAPFTEWWQNLCYNRAKSHSPVCSVIFSRNYVYLSTVTETISFTTHVINWNAVQQHLTLISTCSLYIQDSRLLYHLIREIKTWLNINHITVHNMTTDCSPQNQQHEKNHNNKNT